MNRSQKASRYGRLVEEKAARRYGLDLDHREVQGVRVDARDSSGAPWEIKGAMSNRKSGPGRFRLWEDQHDVLTAKNGGYVFVRYRSVDGGIRVQGMRTICAANLSISWGGSGDHRRNSEQAKILANSIL